MARRARKQRPIQTLDRRGLRHPFAPQSIFSDDETAHIHDQACHVLAHLGMKILLPEARELLKRAEAKVVDETVHFPRDMVDAALASAPKTLVQKAPNPAQDLDIREGSMIFAPAGGCPNVSDRIRGRRPGDLESYVDGVKLMQHFDVIHKLSPAPEPQDVPVHLRHYAMMETQLLHSDKPLSVYGRGRKQVTQCFEMIAAALELSDDAFSAAPWCSCVVNTNSPRLLDNPMAQALIDFARAGQMIVVTPFCLAGAMAPITVAGALLLQHAEALAAITLNQIAKPGAPVMYGGFSSNVHMKSGAPAFGTPEHIQMTIGSGQLARHIGLPWRSAAGVASNTNDMQATHETLMSLWATLQANATLTFHGAGWLEGGLTFGFEKFIQDIEALQTFAAIAQPLDMSEDALGMGALEQVQPGGHFFDTDQTMTRFATAFAEPVNADLRSYGTWEKAGAETADMRATRIWQDIVANAKPPAGAQDRVERIRPMINAFTDAGGANIVD